MSYRIEQVASRRDSFGSYRYRIYEDGRLIAHYWHDHKGDDHGIEFVNGVIEDGPVGAMTDFLEGGGPQPLTLSKRAMEYLKQKQTGKP